MVKVDLITGFLGSGKTTFIKKYARYLMEQGQNIGILENDFGAINVDMMLLHELEGENCELEMVAGGCDKDCYRRRFKTKLIAMGMCGYDRVLIEPSGIFDVDDFFDALHEEPLDRWYQIGNVITVVDASLEKTISKEADYVLASEVANAGCVLLSKTQDASAEEIRQTVAHLNRALQEIHCSRVLKDEVICKDWEDFTEKEFKKILESGYLVEDYEKLYVDQDEIFQTLFFMDEKIAVYDARIEELAHQKRYEENVRKLCCFKGVSTHTALPLLVEVGDFHRFRTAQHFSAYLGLVPGESSSGEKVIHTNITKAGNSHLRTLLVESANSYSRGVVGKKSKVMKDKQGGNSPEIIAYADKANERLHRKFYKIAIRSKKNVAKTAIARELSCFVWGMMTNHISRAV